MVRDKKKFMSIMTQIVVELVVFEGKVHMSM